MDIAPRFSTEWELSAPVPELRPGPSTSGEPYAAARILVRFHGAPVAVVEVPMADGGLAPADVHRAVWRDARPALDRHLGAEGEAPLAGPEDLERLRAPRPDGSGWPCRVTGDTPAITVVVATRNRPDHLVRCLSSLRELDYPRVDVVVVDNAPSDDRTREVVERLDGGAGWLTYVREPRPGASVARNAGVRVATGEILAFADDDTRADPGWLSAIMRGFSRHPGVRWVAGLVQPGELDWPSQILFERAFGWGSRPLEPYLFDLVDHPAPTPLHPYAFAHLGCGGNAAVRRETFRELGGFDEALGAGTKSSGGEDLDYALRVVRAGHVLAYEPSAIMWHYHRSDPAALQRQVYGYGVGLGAFITKLVSQRDSRAEVLRRVPPAVRHYVSAPSTKNENKRAGYPAALLAREFLGLLTGPVAYGRSRRHLRRTAPAFTFPD